MTNKTKPKLCDGPDKARRCEFPGCQAEAHDAIGGIWHCAAHVDWAVQLADDREAAAAAACQ